MQIKNTTSQQIKSYFNNLDEYIKTLGEPVWIKYLDLGVKVVRLISYSEEFKPHVEKQLTYVLKDSVNNFDDTLVIWKEEDIAALEQKVDPTFNPKTNHRVRLEQVLTKTKQLDLQIYNDEYSKCKAQLDFNLNQKVFLASCPNEHKYYYGVNNLEPEEFIKQGHIFIQLLNDIVKTPVSGIVHGAVIGWNNIGALFCARGQRGKSTLAVLSMIRGFEYVSDDYLILEKEKSGVYSYPIYSIITLSPRMYNELYDELDGTRFVSNNARKDKYVVNISNFHDRFKYKYPIKFCLFPEIVSDKDPSIEPCEKGRAIVQLIQSTLSQTRDLNDRDTIQKLYNMVKDFDFYKLNLCSDIERNTVFLREFLENFDKRERKEFDEGKILVDVTYDIASIINRETYTIYVMNKFATNVYENLKRGVAKKLIIEALKDIPNAERDIEIFDSALKDTEVLDAKEDLTQKPNINFEFIEECNGKMSFIEYNQEKNIELISPKKENKNELCIK